MWIIDGSNTIQIIWTGMHQTNEKCNENIHTDTLFIQSWMHATISPSLFSSLCCVLFSIAWSCKWVFTIQLFVGDLRLEIFAYFILSPSTVVCRALCAVLRWWHRQQQQQQSRKGIGVQIKIQRSPYLRAKTYNFIDTFVTICRCSFTCMSLFHSVHEHWFAVRVCVCVYR